KLVGDIVGLLAALPHEIAGHVWGAPVAWNAALFRPDLFPAAIGLSVPLLWGPHHIHLRSHDTAFPVDAAGGRPGRVPLSALFQPGRPRRGGYREGCARPARRLLP